MENKKTNRLKAYSVYGIKVRGVIRYIGYTNNLERRRREHIKGMEGDFKKELYIKIRELNEGGEFFPIREFKNVGDARRFEALLILEDYFRGRELWQSFPVAIKYF